MRHSFSQRLQVSERIYNASLRGADLTSPPVVNCHTPVQSVFPFSRKSSIDLVVNGKSVDLDIPPTPKKSIRNYRKPNSRSDLNDID